MNYDSPRTAALYTVLMFRKAPSWKTGLSAGIVGALLCLIRPNFLVIFPPAFFIVTCLIFRFDLKTKNISKGKLVGCFLAGTFAFTLLILPIIIWNNINSETIVLFTTNGAETYKIANSYDSSVFNFTYPDEGVMPVTSLAFWTHQLKKAGAFWVCYEAPQNVNFYSYKHYSTTLKLLFINFGVFSALFFASFLVFRKKVLKYWLLYFYTIIYSLTIIAFFIIGRFRVPIMPFMAVIGAGVIYRLYLIYLKSQRKPEEKRYKLTLVSYSTVILLLFAMTAPWFAPVPPQYWRNLASKFFMEFDAGGMEYSLNQYIKYADKEKRKKSIKDSVLTLIALYTFLGEFDNAGTLISNLGADKDDKLVVQTLKEYGIMKGVFSGKLDLKVWMNYLNTQKEIGSIARFYIQVQRIRQLRAKFNLPGKNSFKR